MTINPGERFRKSKFVQTHLDVTASDAFAAAAEAALLAYQMDLPVNVGDEEAARSFWKITGAREFLYILLNIAETLQPTKPLTPNKLRHDV